MPRSKLQGFNKYSRNPKPSTASSLKKTTKKQYTLVGKKPKNFHFGFVSAEENFFFVLPELASIQTRKIKKRKEK